MLHNLCRINFLFGKKKKHMYYGTQMRIDRAHSSTVVIKMNRKKFKFVKNIKCQKHISNRT